MNVIAANVLICYDMLHNDKELQDIEIIDHKRDENVLKILHYIMYKQRWRLVFLNDFNGLNLIMQKFDSNLKARLPDLYQHFREEDMVIQDLYR